MRRVVVGCWLPRPFGLSSSKPRHYPRPFGLSSSKPGRYPGSSFSTERGCHCAARLRRAQPERFFGGGSALASTGSARTGWGVAPPPSGCACVGMARASQRACFVICLAAAGRAERASAQRVPRRTPQPTRRRCAPSHREGVADGGSPFFGVLFFGEAKKSASPAGATSRLRRSTRARVSHRPTRLRQAQPERFFGGARPGFDRLSPNGLGAQLERFGVAPRLRRAQPERVGGNSTGYNGRNMRGWGALVASTSCARTAGAAPWLRQAQPERVGSGVPSSPPPHLLQTLPYHPSIQHHLHMRHPRYQPVICPRQSGRARRKHDVVAVGKPAHKPAARHLRLGTL